MAEQLRQYDLQQIYSSCTREIGWLGLNLNLRITNKSFIHIGLPFFGVELAREKLYFLKHKLHLAYIHRRKAEKQLNPIL